MGIKRGRFELEMDMILGSTNFQKRHSNLGAIFFANFIYFFIYFIGKDHPSIIRLTNQMAD